MAEGEQKISMQDVSDKAGDAQEAAAPQEDAYAGITSEDVPKETQRPASMLQTFHVAAKLLCAELIKQTPCWANTATPSAARSSPGSHRSAARWAKG